jgi:hypothetical protein
MKVGPIVILLLFTFNVSHSQTLNRTSGSSAHSSLTVTATVEPSVWLIMEPDGRRDVLVANAPDPRESFSHAPAKAHRNDTARKQAAAPNKSANDAVQFTLPAPKRFDVSEKTVMMDISEGGKTGRRLVTVTTVVPQ